MAARPPGSATPGTPTPVRAPAAPRVLPPGPRRVALVVHVVASVGWLGVDAVLLLLAVTGLLTADPALLRGSYLAIGLITVALLIPVSMMSLVSGLVLGLGTPWGVLRYRWVVVKLAINVALVVAILLALRPRTEAAATLAAASPEVMLDRAVLRDLPRALVFPPVVSAVALLVATVLAVVKPWGPTRYGERVLAARAAARRRARPGPPAAP